MQANNPLHGVTLARMLETLLARLGWQGLVRELPFRCFEQDQSVKSALNFLRKTPWARQKFEARYLLVVINGSESLV